MRAWQQRKDTVLLPVTKLLNFLGIKPVAVSVAGILVAGITLWLSFVYTTPGYFLLGLLAHVVIDGIDGSLARNHRLDTDSGALVDTVADYVVSIMALTFIARFTPIPLWLLTSVGAIYGLLLAIAYIRNERGIPYRFMPRGRLGLYVLLFVHIWAGVLILAPALLTWLVLSLWLLVTGVRALQQQRRPL
ncbi:hypothetical protein CL628_02645 [bacterium]|nr:hypothetical protein [bacterium]